MNIYDKAHELARALKQAQEYQALVIAQEKLRGDNAAFKMFVDYRRKEIAYQTTIMSGKEMDEAELKTLERLVEIISANSLVRDYMQAEARFGTIYGDVQRIINEAVKELGAMYTQDQEGGNI